jgi:tetratricopeptide (TPR) repeat protein
VAQLIGPQSSSGLSTVSKITTKDIENAKAQQAAEDKKQISDAQDTAHKAAKLTKALSSVPDHAPGHMYLGVVEMSTKRAAEGIAECEHALALDRNLAQAHSLIGLGKIYIGRAQETEAHIAEALRLSPRDTRAYVWMSHVGMAKNHLGSWEQAAAWFRRAIEANRNYPLAFFQLALPRLSKSRSRAFLPRRGSGWRLSPWG